jgi:hypothetical protein
MYEKIASYESGGGRPITTQNVTDSRNKSKK